ncbi:MAG: hypothetical protein AAF682_17315 [Planctomycetota bacterium]
MKELSNRPSLRTAWPFLPALACLWGACSTPAPAPEPTELAAPELELERETYAGGILAGPAADAPVSPEPESALRARVSLVYLREPLAGLAPLAERLQVLATPLHGAPVRATPRAAAGGGFGAGPEALALLEAVLADPRAAFPLAEVDTVLPSGAVVRFAATRDEEVDDPDNYLGEFRRLGPVRKELAVLVGRDAEGALELGLVLEDLAPPIDPPEDPAPGVEPSRILRPGAPVPLRELMLLDAAPAPGEGPLVLSLRSPFDAGEGGAFAAVVEVTPVPEGTAAAAHAAELEQLVATLTEQAALDALEGEHDGPDSEARRALTLALGAVRPERPSRGLLLRLAERSEVEALADLALVADDDVLAAVSARIAAVAEEPTDTWRTRAEVGWLLEHSALTELAERAAGTGLPDELASVLTRRVGEPAHSPGILLEFLAASLDVADLERRLIAENRIYLEDTSPGARVRAHEWLTAREAAPAGFDPLAEAAERRRALAEAFQEAPR